MYYQMLPNADPDALRIAVGIADTTGQYEPSIVEKIVAITYLLLGGEVLWVSRIYTSLFWLIGGVALYDLARRMTSFGGALVALAYYLDSAVCSAGQPLLPTRSGDGNVDHPIGLLLFTAGVQSHPGSGRSWQAPSAAWRS